MHEGTPIQEEVVIGTESTHKVQAESSTLVPQETIDLSRKNGYMERLNAVAIAIKNVYDTMIVGIEAAVGTHILTVRIPNINSFGIDHETLAMKVLQALEEKAKYNQQSIVFIDSDKPDHQYGDRKYGKVTKTVPSNSIGGKIMRMFGGKSWALQETIELPEHLILIKAVVTPDSTSPKREHEILEFRFSVGDSASLLNATK